MDYKKQLIEER